MNHAAVSDSDEQLVRRVLAGNTECFRMLVERYQDAVFGVALSQTGSFPDAEDAAQETFLAAFESLGRLKDPARFGSWLYGIALNKVKMHLRRRRDRPPAEGALGPAAQAPRPDEVAAQRETREALMAALARLSAAHREAATLYYINGYSQKDISRFTDCPVGTVKTRLHDARRRLRKELVAMVEQELKRARPGRKFTERVLRKVSQVRVWLSGGEQNVLLLTDARKRSFMIVIGKAEAEALQPWLAGTGRPEAPDIHTALVRTLAAFAARIEEVVVGELKAHTFHATLTVRSGRGSAELDCRPSDAINLAARAGAPIYVNKEVADACLIKGPGGKPLSTRAAWDSVRHGVLGRPRKGVFRDVLAVIQALEKDPDNALARQAICEATPWQGFVHIRRVPPLVKNPGGAVEALQDWLQRSHGTRLEAPAAGLLGATYLWTSTREPENALPHLERACRLRPGDERIAFDLATAYALAGKADRAIALLRKHRFEKADKCGNFAALRRDPRFRKIAGRPEPSRADLFVSAQLGREIHTRPPLGKMIPKRPAAAGGKAIPLPKLGRQRLGQFQRRLDCGRLLGVEGLLPHLQGKRNWLALGVRPNRRAALPVTAAQARTIHAALVQSPRPLTPKTFCNALADAGIKPEAVALLKRGRRGIEAALLAHAGRTQAAISMAAPAALAVALAAKCPVLITQALAGKLYVRGKSGRRTGLSACPG